MGTLKENWIKTKANISASFKSGMEKTKRFFRRIFRLLLLFIALCIAGYFLWASYVYSKGTRSGLLIKVSEKGYIFKTCEGQLNLGGFEGSVGGGDIIGNIWNFSVKKEAIYQELQKHEGKKVILHYKQVNNAMPWQGDTDYFITKVELVE
jgi:hypothetical protein